MNCGSVFSGIGLLDYGLHQAGIKHAWFCESDEWRRGILHKRWPDARVHADVRHVGHGCEPVDLIAGGFPCKGASTAGKRNGFDQAETVLWREMARAVGELRPRYVLVENVAHILALHDGAVWGEVLGDLAAFGYDVVWDCLPAGAVGAPHRRDRVFCIASYADGARRPAGWEPERAGSERQRDVADEVAPDVVAYADAAHGQGHRGSIGVRPQVTGDHGDRAATAADADGDGVREQPEPERGRSGRAIAPGAGEAAADAAGLRERSGADEPPRHDRGGPQRMARPGTRSDHDDRREGSRGRRGVAVEWGDYEPAIHRWEAIHGPAPEPLVRRVDDRGAARVERSRLSALGDGVQCQIGRIAGEYIVGLERRRLGEAA